MSDSNKNIANNKLKEATKVLNDTNINEKQEEKQNKMNILSTQITSNDCNTILLAIDTIIGQKEGIERSMNVCNLIQFIKSKTIQDNQE